MDPRHTTPKVGFRLARQRSGPLVILREPWWSHDRRRYRARLSEPDRRHPLDEGYVADAMTRQLEEIRSLPEAVR
ncbi:MAG: hypothetical protein JO304_23080 [Solirubrobacterales bacterium]|nr:hypothetical protein [Solirubrobacterales bacterium]